MKSLSICLRIFQLVGSWAYGVLFLWASYTKIIEPDVFARQVARYQIISPKASAMVGAVLPWFEFFIGCCLLLSFWKAGAWLATVILFGCFAIARALVLHKGLSIECGCGVMDGIITPESVINSLAFFTIALLGLVSEIHLTGGARCKRRLPGTARRSSSQGSISSEPAGVSV